MAIDMPRGLHEDRARPQARENVAREPPISRSEDRQVLAILGAQGKLMRLLSQLREEVHDLLEVFSDTPFTTRPAFPNLEASAVR
jgi:hypothetical protein